MSSGINPRDFTDAVGKALEEAQDLAREKGNMQVSPLHVAAIVFGEKHSVAQRSVEGAGASVSAVTSVISRAIRKLPSQSPAPLEVGLNADLIRTLQRATKVQKENGDG